MPAATVLHRPISRDERRKILGRESSRDLTGDGPRDPRRAAPHAFVTTEACLAAFGLESPRDLPDTEQGDDAGLAGTEALQDAMTTGTVAEGQGLPGERRLSAEPAISRVTVRRALEVLERTCRSLDPLWQGSGSIRASSGAARSAPHQGHRRPVSPLRCGQSPSALRP